MKRESSFQASLIKKIKKRFPESVVMKTDPNYIQGFPDLLILFNDCWAALECKRTVSSSKRPNQEYYVDKLGKMSYANFVYPENEEVILNELQQAFGPGGSACIPERK